MGVLEERKAWFVKYSMKNFLLAVPNKLEGRVDVALGCDVVRAYMALELSNAVSMVDSSQGVAGSLSKHRGRTHWI